MTTGSFASAYAISSMYERGESRNSEADSSQHLAENERNDIQHKRR